MSNKLGGFKTKLWPVCGTNDLRPALEHAFIKDGNIVATNAHVLIRQSLVKFHDLTQEEASFLEGKFIHHSILKEIHRYERVEFKEDGIHCYLKLNSKTLTVFSYTPFDGKYVNFESVLKENASGNVSKIGLDLSLLKIIKDAMHHRDHYINYYRFDFLSQSERVIISHPQFSKSECLSLVMPCMLNDEY